MPSKMIIRKCAIHGDTKHRKKLSGYFKCVKCEIEAINKLRYIRKIELIKLGGGCCIICGYDKYAGALEFHHRNPSNKKFNLCLSNMTKKWNVILDEFSKCDLLCRNCHSEVHHAIRSYKLRWPKG